MENIKTKWTPKLNEFVEDLSGTIGQVTGIGEYGGTVRVSFGKYGTNWRDLKIDQLKPSKYSFDQLEKIRSVAPQMLEALLHAQRAMVAMANGSREQTAVECFQLLYGDNEINNVIKKATE